MDNKISSPLRYPGGKSKLTPFIDNVLYNNQFSNPIYIEPFAGGAGIALNLLLSNKVSEIYLNDKDISIYSFWQTILRNKNKLIDKIFKTPITIDEWLKQRDIQTNKIKHNQFDIAFSTLFLNRTNRSGIIKAGAIGGKSQSSFWKLDARFNKETIVNRIEMIHAKKKQIKVFNEDAIEFINSKIIHLPRKQSLIYFDPPYYNKGNQLYMNFFEHNDHLKIATYIKTLKHKWIVSYDDTPEIKEMYKYVKNTKNIFTRYSAGKSSLGKEILFASNKLII